MLLLLRRVGERCSLQRNEPACVVGEQRQEMDLVLANGGGVTSGISTFISFLITPFSIASKKTRLLDFGVDLCKSWRSYTTTCLGSLNRENWIIEIRKVVDIIGLVYFISSSIFIIHMLDSLVTKLWVKSNHKKKNPLFIKLLLPTLVITHTKINRKFYPNLFTFW